MSRRRRTGIHAVVLAGGAGTRFWPLSRRDRPKPLLRVNGTATLLGETLSRARRFAARERVWLVCGREHAAAMGRASDLVASQILVEPRMRNTAAAVGLAALRIGARDPQAVMAVLPADHHVPDAAAFAAAIRQAAAAAAEGVLVTLGVRPTRAETGYGWIRLGAAASPDHPGLHRVARFVEKPDRARARRYWRSGRYLWNAGVFVWSVQTILEEMEALAPEVYRALRPAAAAASAPGAQWRRAVERAYARVPSVAVDTAVLERSRRVWCLPVDFHWSDVGTWKSLAQELGVDGNVTHVMAGDALLCDAGGNLVYAGDRPVVLLGVEGLAIVDAGDALLVADLERSPDVREVVALLERRGRGDLL